MRTTKEGVKVTPIIVRVPLELRDKIDERAHRQGKSRSKFAEEAIQLVIDALPGELFSLLLVYAERKKCDVTEIINNAVRKFVKEEFSNIEEAFLRAEEKNSS